MKRIKLVSSRIITLTLLLTLSLAGLSLLLARPAVVRAATIITVTSNVDGGGTCPNATDCTLRQAIAIALSGDTINFSLPVNSVITLTIGELLINKSLTINGPGANLLSVQRDSSAANFRIFNIAPPISIIVTISGLTITNGNASGSNGGGVSTSGSLTITNSAISGNSAGGGTTGGGGGIYNTGVLTVTNSTISGNQASGYGGGIYNSGTLNLTNSTISGNSVSGGIFYGGGIFNDGGGTVTITNGTISGNTAQYSGGGIVNFTGTVTARNTIIAQNSAGGGGGHDGSGALTSQGFNLVGNSSGATISPVQPSDQIGVTPAQLNLNSLQNNGGPTQTHVLLAGSTAIDKGHSSGSSSDQRGFPRPLGTANVSGGDGSDIGAFEVQASTLSLTSVVPPAGRTSGGQSVVLTGSFTNLSMVTLGGVSVPWVFSNGFSEVTLNTLPHAAGAVNIDLTPTTGSPYTRNNAFAYLPTVFTDDTLVVGVTTAQAQHILELRQAVDALRLVAGLGPAAWTDPTLVPGSTVIKAVHITELRSNLETAAALLGYSAGNYTDPGLGVGLVIKRVHIEELRQRIRNLADCLTITSVNLTPPTCLGETNGQITVNATGGAGTLSYSKDGGANFQASNVFSGLAAGPYHLVVKNAVGCSQATIVTLTITPNPSPTLSYSNQTVTGGTTPSFGPATGPSDNGTLMPITLQSITPSTGMTLSVNPTTGVVTVTSASLAGSYTVVISVTDNCGATTNATFTVNVVCPTVTVNPASLPNATLNTAYPQTITASPAGGNYTFAVTSGALPAGLTLNSNGSFSGAPWESGLFNFRITASGFGGCTGFRDYVLTVDCPSITLSPASLPGGTVGTGYSQSVSASPAGFYNYSVTSGALPNGLSLNNSTGAITGTPTQAGTSNFFTITASQGGCSGSRSYTVAIACNGSIMLGALSNGTAGTAYSGSVAASPSGSYTYSVVAGNLPSGLALNPSTGAITGLPTVAGTDNFTIKADAGNGCSGTQAYTLVVGCPTIAISPASLPNGTVGTAYSQTLTATPATGTYSCAVSSGSLPTGLNLIPATGVLSGTPTASGTFNFTITATGFGSCASAPKAYAIVISGGGCPTITLPNIASTGTVGALYNQSVNASPAGSYTYLMTSGAPPPGVTFYAGAALLFGYPTTVGSSTFTIKATSASDPSCTGMKTYTITVSAGS